MPKGKSTKTWVPVGERYPLIYELVRVRYEDGSQVSCWWTGAAWDGSREIRTDEIVAWKSHYMPNTPNAR